MTAIRGARAPKPFSYQNGIASETSPDIISSMNEDYYITNIGTSGHSQSRAIIADENVMKGLSIGFDDIVDGFIQTVYSIHALDDMCKKLTMKDGELNLQLLKELNPDSKLFSELINNLS